MLLQILKNKVVNENLNVSNARHIKNMMTFGVGNVVPI